jgi:hypothetical protein
MEEASSELAARMNILLPAFAFAFAALCVWLTVRIVNRRERWAKWTLAAAVGLPLMYVASFGPASRLVTEMWVRDWMPNCRDGRRDLFIFVYGRLQERELSGDRIGDAILWYEGIWFYGFEVTPPSPIFR